jgi:hypothetical protein
MNFFEFKIDFLLLFFLNDALRTDVFLIVLVWIKDTSWVKNALNKATSLRIFALNWSSCDEETFTEFSHDETFSRFSYVKLSIEYSHNEVSIELSSKETFFKFSHEKKTIDSVKLKDETLSEVCVISQDERLIKTWSWYVIDRFIKIIAEESSCDETTETKAFASLIIWSRSESLKVASWIEISYVFSIVDSSIFVRKRLKNKFFEMKKKINRKINR